MSDLKISRKLQLKIQKKSKFGMLPFGSDGTQDSSHKTMFYFRFIQVSFYLYIDSKFQIIFNILPVLP